MDQPKAKTLIGHELTQIRISKSALSLTLVSIVLGLSITLVRPVSEAGRGTDETRSTDVVGATVKQLEHEQQELKEAVSRSQRELQTYQQLAVARTSSLKDISDELERQRFVAGAIPLRGPGVRIILDDSPKIPADTTDVGPYLVHDFQLRDVVNVLWQAGVEAISINNERVVGGGAIFGVGNAILVNGTRLTPPYEIKAIGDVSSLYPLLTNVGTLYQLKSTIDKYGIVLRIERGDQITVPAFKGAFQFKFARVGGSP